jgi:biopolymer transport protein ExbD
MEPSDDLVHGESDVTAISDINVTPFIDVMLVLLIIFMVTAPLMMGGVKINLPKTNGTPMQRPERPLIVSLDAESRVYVDKDEVLPNDRSVLFRDLAIASESGEVFVRGDGEVKYGRMMDLMSELGQAGFARVTLVTNVQQNTADAAANASSDSAVPPASEGTAPTAPPSPMAGTTPSPTASTQSAPGTPGA